MRVTPLLDGNGSDCNIAAKSCVPTATDLLRSAAHAANSRLEKHVFDPEIVGYDMRARAHYIGFDGAQDTEPKNRIDIQVARRDDGINILKVSCEKTGESYPDSLVSPHEWQARLTLALVHLAKGISLG